ncbi:hypothetical protein [Mangrovicoccus sp. HB161399]|uniref:hypothetical protein n=1 Tax=Mangrovicoccus sp. HB161399 TaxID=2720392 RepID=UPI0015548A1C|nr:hypothetical protein [Mangrovicoccus sp. HB161399]
MEIKVGLDDLVGAVRLCRAYLKGKADDRIVARLDNNGVQAAVTSDGTLLIDGSNEVYDWLGINIDVFESVARQTAMGDSGKYEWHAGFLKHAQTVFAFASGLSSPPKLIIGHSLGAASAQIVGSSLRVPTIAFASPLTQRIRRFKKTKRPQGRHWVLNIQRADDLVCGLPPKWLGFAHVGNVLAMSPKGVHDGQDHSTKNYLNALRDGYMSKQLQKHLPLALGASAPADS